MLKEMSFDNIKPGAIIVFADKHGTNTKDKDDMYLIIEVSSAQVSACYSELNLLDVNSKFSKQRQLFKCVYAEDGKLLNWCKDYLIIESNETK